ncbi:LOW QUALITY PROTEIN: hypothetical protein MAR_017386 [Mya arenaria]|uniref:Hemerythrin-like domain-containing protein n=1 Tax=Mya arenaria TaxID=6604 RepID=A0ABY7EBM3_MYAAR|nr:LOW QUALITY PROTEIN: hypothetical protein MAR_017386 [Mya arenaria]
MSNKTTVAKHVDTTLKAREEEKVEVLQHTHRQCYFCALHSIALRGIRDDSKYINEAVSNCGNFQALLEFRAEARDSVLKEHFASAHKNHTTKNDICKILDAYENKIYAHLMKEELFRTRWVEREDALEIFSDFLPGIVEAMSKDYVWQEVDVDKVMSEVKVVTDTLQDVRSPHRRLPQGSRRHWGLNLQSPEHMDAKRTWQMRRHPHQRNDTGETSLLVSLTLCYCK